MNLKSTFSNDNVLDFKIKILMIYCLVFIITVLWTDGSALDLLEQLLLQVGNAISGTSPVKVTT